MCHGEDGQILLSAEVVEDTAGNDDHGNCGRLKVLVAVGLEDLPAALEVPDGVRDSVVGETVHGRVVLFRGDGGLLGNFGDGGHQVWRLGVVRSS